MDLLRPRHRAPSGPGDPQWPMSVAAFLAGRFLRRADIVLTRKRRGVSSWFVRWATRGKFSHVALVFLVPHQDVGFDNTFAIEAAWDGIGLTNLLTYLNDGRSMVGIKRLSQPWFDMDVQRIVRGRLLGSIESPYSHAKVGRIVLNLVDRVLYGVHHRLAGPEKALNARLRRNLTAPNAFMCSGLVQLGFLSALGDLVRQARLPPHAFADIVFDAKLAPIFDNIDWARHGAAEQLEIVWDTITGCADVLAAVTPEELAGTPKLEWIYVVREGMVYPVRSELEAGQLLDWTPG
ncbi:MAG: hypothetical protein ACREC6_15185 [Hyphomicrobiaceae bacterium]